MTRRVDRDAKREGKWREHYKCLLRFIKREGHSRVPARHIENGFRLGRWVVKQREDREHMSKERLKSLEKLDGWFWKGQEAKWDRARMLLEQFVARNGHAIVPKKHIEDGFNLGIWVMHVRDQHKRGELPKDRERYLENIKGWVWSPAEKQLKKTAKRPVKPKTLTEKSSDELAEMAWGILFGEGPIREYLAIHRLARHFHNEQILRARHARQGSPLAHLLNGVLKRGIALGYIDQPRPRYIRSILRDHADYQPEDWRRCLIETLEQKPVPVETAIRDAATWASDALGLDCAEVNPKDEIWRELQKAINSGIRKGEFERLSHGAIRVNPRRKRA